MYVVCTLSVSVSGVFTLCLQGLFLFLLGLKLCNCTKNTKVELNSLNVILLIKTKTFPLVAGGE